jgi:hypothetical protein
MRWLESRFHTDVRTRASSSAEFLIGLSRNMAPRVFSATSTISHRGSISEGYIDGVLDRTEIPLTLVIARGSSSRTPYIADTSSSKTTSAMTTPSILSALMKTSIKINGVLIPGRKATNSLQRFCRPVCFFNEGSDYELSSAGSCLLFKYRRHCMAFFARHQLGKGDAARLAREFCIIVEGGPDGKIALTPDAVASPQHPPGYGFAEDIQFI